MGVTKLRLARFGSHNRPFYRMVAIDSRKSRDSKPIEYLGTFDPIPAPLDGIKEIRLEIDRVKYWLAVGAQPSERVAYLLWRAGLLPPPPIRFSPTKSKKRKEEEGGADAKPAAPAAPPAAKAAAGAKKFHTLTDALLLDANLFGGGRVGRSSSSSSTLITSRGLMWMSGMLARKR